MLTLGHRSYVDGEALIHFPNGEVRVGNYTSIANRVVFLCGGSTAHACQTSPVVSTFPLGEFLGGGYPGGPFRNRKQP